MRKLFLVSLVIAGCGSHATATGPAPATSASVSPTMTASPTPRVTTAPSLQCMASLVGPRSTMSDIASRADLIVRAVAVSEDVVQLRPGFGPRATRDARRTTLTVTSVVRTTGEHPSEVRVLEDVCANLGVAPGEEWLLFLRKWTSPDKYGPDDPRPHWVSVSGPLSQFRFHGGAVSGPFFEEARLVRTYEGASVTEVLSDIP